MYINFTVIPWRDLTIIPILQIKDLLSLGSLSNLAKVTTWWSEGLNPGVLGPELGSTSGVQTDTLEQKFSPPAMY